MLTDQPVQVRADYVQYTWDGKASPSVRTMEARIRMLRARYDVAEPEPWLMLNGGPMSMLVCAESVARTSEHGWLAQMGTPPVQVDGSWGGRNYPGISIPAAEMRRVWRELEVVQ